jgi:hypothetical protein
VFTAMDIGQGVLGWLWGDGGQEDTGPPCLRVHGLSVHDEAIPGLRACLISYGERGKHGMLLKTFVLLRCLLNPTHGG